MYNNNKYFLIHENVYRLIRAMYNNNVCCHYIKRYIYFLLYTHTRIYTMFKLFNDKSIQLIFLDKLYFSTTFNSLLLILTLSN